ncbi:cysteine proteinase [Delitschia confertaspora ATCC 74209]|uniref:Cysteine proteinase n=1 Tax=Delitschia confertaspora ATCC 74209 TaxID=1513339 RepID=A0A9P4JFX1_9PLEO|nr:cysteine proteinase [Delitschia confertaspora ATCC 74209]
MQLQRTSPRGEGGHPKFKLHLRTKTKEVDPPAALPHVLQHSPSVETPYFSSLPAPATYTPYPIDGMSSTRCATAQEAEFPGLRAAGLQLFDIKGDGNCLFRAFSDQLFGHPNHHTIVRDTIVQYVRDHKDHYINFVPVNEVRRSNRRHKGSSSREIASPSQDEREKKFEMRLQQMAKTGTWGDNVEIVAFAAAYDVQVNVWQREYNYTLPDDAASSSLPKVQVAFHVSSLSSLAIR